MAAVSIVALSAVMYGCVHSGDDPVEVEAPDLGPAQTAAKSAADAAKAASDAAARRRFLALTPFGISTRSLS